MRKSLDFFAYLVFVSIILLGAVFLFRTVIAVNSAPSVSSVVLNSGNAITLTANSTTSFDVSFVVTDNDGCADVFTNGTTSVRVFRTSLGNSCVENSNNCYVGLLASNSCTGTSTTANATATVNIYYFADATDSSSSFSSDTWTAFVQATDAASATGTATSSALELNTLLAIDVVSTSTSYGSTKVNQNTSSTNQRILVRLTGNASATIQVSGGALVSGSNTMATSSQHYATSTFVFGGSEQVLSSTAATITGFTFQKATLGSFVSGQSLPSNRNQHDAVISSSTIYMIGGSSTSSVLYASLGVDGSIGSWSLTTSLPSALSNHRNIVYGGFIYTLGGNDGSGTTTVLYAPLNSSGTIGSWSQTTALPASLYGQAAALHNGFIYLSGGFSNGNRTSTVIYAPINASGTVGSWTETTPLPANIVDVRSVAQSGYIYLSGGQESNGGLTSTVLYAPINTTGSIGSWSLTTSMPYGIGGHGFLINNSNLYVVGGVDNNSVITSTVSFAPINSNGTVGSWVDTKPLPSAIRLSGVAVNNGFMYSVGGLDSDHNATSSAFFSPIGGGNTFWGLSVASGTATGTYTGTNTFNAVFSP